LGSGAGLVAGVRVARYSCEQVFEQIDSRDAGPGGERAWSWI
jgi:hypothetical protein